VDTQALAGLLADWLPQQRWYAGKGRPVVSVTVSSASTLAGGDPRLDHLVAVVDHGDGADRYQLLVGLTGEPAERVQHALIGAADNVVAYDAMHDPGLTRILLGALAAGGDVPPLRFRHAEGVEIDPEPSSIVLGGEQSNTSVVYGEDYVLKLFRRLSPGLNPDLEVSRAAAAGGSPHVAAPLGWIEGDLDGEATTLALLQPFLHSAVEGWAMAVTSVRDLFAEGDLHADEVGGDFAAEAVRLGAATADVHAALARALPTRLRPAAENAHTAAQLRERLDAAIGVVPALAEHADALRSAYDAVRRLADPVPLQRIHGDLHLGQTMRTDSGWMLLDFEGEPARPLAERAAPSSPLRDVAGMLRSFDYAARHLLATMGSDPQLEYRAGEWGTRNRDAFCDGYAEASGGDPREQSVLLRAFELDKAVYEAAYEARSRPSWLPIPLGSIADLTK
jgi:maltokinase